jgi:hypothetical protein
VEEPVEALAAGIEDDGVGLARHPQELLLRNTPRLAYLAHLEHVAGVRRVVDLGVGGLGRLEGQG